MLEWVWPYLLALAPAPLLMYWLAPPAAHRQAALQVPDVSAFDLRSAAGPPAKGRRWPWRALLLWLAWLALLAAAARPQWTGEPVALPTSGRDLMLAVDISGSMGTADMQLGGEFVERLAVVKQVVEAFVSARQGDRVGLILFGTQAYLQAPLTFDLTSVNRLLQEAPVGIAGGKTAIGDAIGLAVKRLRQRPEGDRVLILLTDGASNAGEVTPIKASELAANDAIRIYTIGVGADEMQMPGLFGVFGSRTVNPSADLDEDSLTAIAAATGGRYFRARNTEKLQEIYGLIDALEPIEQDPETYRPTAALYQWPLAIAWLLVCLLALLQWRSPSWAQRGSS